MDCNVARSRLHAYLDHELDVPGVLEVERHVASCPACRRVFGQFAALQSGVRKHAQYHAVPEGLAERIRGQTVSLAKEGLVQSRDDDPVEAVSARAWPRRPAARYSLVARWLELGAVAAAAAAVSWLVAFQYASYRSSEALAEQIFAGHARAVLTNHVVDIETSDQHTVKPWLSSKLDFSPSVVDLAGQGFPLVGGRLDYLDHRLVATLVYQARQHVIDLYVWPAETAGATKSTQALAKQGYNAVHWAAAGLQYWAVSDLNATELESFAASYSAAAE